MPEHPLCAVTRSTRVIEHFADLGAETGQDRGLEESVKTGKLITIKFFCFVDLNPLLFPAPPPYSKEF